MNDKQCSPDIADMIERLDEDLLVVAANLLGRLPCRLSESELALWQQKLEDCRDPGIHTGGKNRK